MRSTAARVPGVGQLPLLGRLFSSTNGNDNKTEIVLSITPRIVRPVAMLPPGLEQFASGTELQVRPRTLTLESAAPVAAADAATAPKPISIPSTLPMTDSPPAPAAVVAPPTSTSLPPGANPEAAGQSTSPRRSRPAQPVDVDLATPR